MTTTNRSAAATDFDSPEHQARLAELYRDFSAVGMTPLWTTREGLMPPVPQPRAVPHLWHWGQILPLAARSAELVPVGRGGERRAISLGNPGLPGDPGHRAAESFMDGPGFMLTFTVSGGGPRADRFLERLGLLVHATSLGGVETTLERRARYPAERGLVPEGLLRVSVGCEHAADLWADIEQALAASAG